MPGKPTTIPLQIKDNQSIYPCGPSTPVDGITIVILSISAGILIHHLGKKKCAWFKNKQTKPQW